jgi:hypothetical protein
MNWGDVSEKSREKMLWLGHFSPTVRAKDGEIKGYMLDADGDGGKTYLTSAELRDLAAACIEVADWLDERKRIVLLDREGKS